MNLRYMQHYSVRGLLRHTRRVLNFHPDDYIDHVSNYVHFTLKVSRLPNFVEDVNLVVSVVVLVTPQP